MKIKLTILFFGFSLSIIAQNLNNFEQIDKYKIDKLTIKVFFKDPLKELIKKYPDFDKKENKEKHDLLSGYLHNNSLYAFQSSKKKEIIKTYYLSGNPKKVKSRNYFNLEVYNSSNSLEKSIDKVNVGGSFFEHMLLFQSSKGKKYVGKGIKIWGFFVMIQPYSGIKNNINEILRMDISNELPQDFLSKEKPLIEPLFEYQKYGLKNIKERTLKITVFQYDSLGNIKNKYPRIEKDTSLYLSSTSKDLLSVTSFPFFSKTDSIIKENDKISIISKLENINHYLKDIEITMNSKTGQVKRIDGKLIIHGYNKDGHYTNDEIYTAEFEKINDCYLPKIIKYYPLTDTELKRPRIIVEVEYKTK